MSEIDALWAKLLEEGKARWMPGAWELYVDDAGLPVGLFVWFSEDGHGQQVWGYRSERSRPDWECPATVGCLLAMAREAWGEPVFTQPPDLGRFAPKDWTVWSKKQVPTIPSLRGHGDTEAMALLRAIEGAP